MKDQTIEMPPLKVGALPTLNQDPYPSLGEWWIQIRTGADNDEVFARVYGASPEQVKQRAEALVRTVEADRQRRGEPVGLGRLLDAANAAVEILGSILDDPEAQRAADELSNSAAEVGRAPFVEPTQLGYTLSDVHEAYSRGRAEALKTQPAEPVKRERLCAQDLINKPSYVEPVKVVNSSVSLEQDGSPFRGQFYADRWAKDADPVKMPSDERINAIADELFDFQRITDKLPSMDRSGFREIIGAAIARYGQTAQHAYGHSGEPMDIDYGHKAQPATSVGPDHLSLADELSGVIADVELGKGFDRVCLDTIKRVRESLLTQPTASAEPVCVVKENPYCPEGRSDEISEYLPNGMKLYAAPVAAQASGHALTDQDGAARVDAVYAALTDRAKRFVSKESVQEVLAAIEAQPHLYDGDTLTAAYMAGQDAARVPDGWKLVPLEPTEEMSGAGWDHIDITVGQCQDGPEDVYRAMLAAAPTPPADGHRVNPTVEPKLDTLPVTPEEEEAWRQLEDK